MIRTLAIAAVVLALASPAFAADKVVLMLNWFVYGEHAPFYYGKAKGLFAAENIDLEIQEGRGSAATTQAVAAKSADFGYVDIPSAMRPAAKGAPVVTLGVLLQTSPMSAISIADKNIRKPEDIKGKVVALAPAGSNEQIWPLFLKKTGLKDSDFTTITGDAKVNFVINNQADVVLGYQTNEAIVVKEGTKKEVYSIRFADYGIKLISSGVIAHKALVKDNPDLVRRFMAAAVKSVEAAMKDPSGAVDAMMVAVPKGGKRESLLEGYNLTIPYYKTADGKSVPLFRMSDDQMNETIDIMVEYGGLDPIVKKDPKSYYTNAFLPN
jgi:NitT/TauT family transport system substrate-binding protein